MRGHTGVLSPRGVSHGGLADLAEPTTAIGASGSTAVDAGGDSCAGSAASGHGWVSACSWPC